MVTADFEAGDRSGTGHATDERAREATAAALAPSVSVERWRRAYATRLFITDLVVVFGAVYGAQWIRFGGRAAELEIPIERAQEFLIGYSGVSLVVALAWMLSLEIFATRDHKVIGTGSTEYRRIADATFRVFGALAIIAFLLQSQLGRGYLLIALPTGLLLLTFSRWAWRQWLNRARAEGRFTQRAIVLGERSKARHVAEQVGRVPDAGISIVGAVTDHGDRHDLLPELPVVGRIDEVLEVMQRLSADTLVFAGTDAIGPRDLRELGWELEKRRVDLIVVPALTDVAGPRIHARPVAGLPLIHVDYPVFEGRKFIAKRAFDVVGSASLIIVLSPVFVLLAALVKASSRGPVLYRQERIGRNGEPFQMLKFRSMIPGAHQQLADLLALEGGGKVPLFKIQQDPRVTPIGRVLRKYSLDELPQLFNVLGGSMSLVGPRPQIAAEVALYTGGAHRRLLLQPGMTGLWQVSGRSLLSWEDSIRLDLFYVENWSMTADVVILFRTVRAVLFPGGRAH